MNDFRQRKQQILKWALLCFVFFTSLAIAKENEADTKHIIQQCETTQCLIGDIANRFSKMNQNQSTDEQAKIFFGEDMLSVMIGSGFEPCDFLPSRQCWSDILTIRQRVYLSEKDNAAAGCIDITGTEDNRKTLVSISLDYKFLNGNWTISRVNKNISINDVFALSDIMKSSCLIPSREA
jgi:hypothetical protein